MFNVKQVISSTELSAKDVLDQSNTTQPTNIQPVQLKTLSTLCQLGDFDQDDLKMDRTQYIQCDGFVKTWEKDTQLNCVIRRCRSVMTIATAKQRVIPFNGDEYNICKRHSQRIPYLYVKNPSNPVTSIRQMLVDATTAATKIVTEMGQTTSNNVVLKLNDIHNMIKHTSDALMHAESDKEINSLEDVISQMKKAMADIQTTQQSTKKRKMENGGAVETKINDIMNSLQDML